MLIRASVVRECEVIGEDASLGKVTDLYVDEYGWCTCYLVVETPGFWSGKRLLVPLSYLLDVDWRSHRVTMRLTKSSLLAANLEDVDLNVAEQLEDHGAGYVAWPPIAPHLEGSTSQVPPGDPEHPGTDDTGKPLLRSVREVNGYAVEATDGPCGHIDDLLIDDETWDVVSLLINPRNFFAGTPRVIPVRWVDECDWLSHCIRMNVNKQTIRESPSYDASWKVGQHAISAMRQ